MKRFRTDQPEWEEPKGNENITASQKAVMEAICKAKSTWLDNCMRNVLPDHLYAVGKNECAQGRDRMRVQAWLSSRSVVIKEFPDRTEFEMRGKVMSTFRFVIEGTNLKVTVHGLTKPPENLKD
jgi:hypothetical protein